MSETGSAPQAPSKSKVFLRRLVTSVALWTVVVTALFSRHRLISDGVFLLVMVLLATAGLVEFYGLVERRGLPAFKYCGLLGGAL